MREKKHNEYNNLNCKMPAQARVCEENNRKNGAY